jgi:hypothetical protein
MKTLPTNQTGYTVKVDVHPYLETKNILSSIQDWWLHPSRSVKEKNRAYSSNYELAEDARNKLGISLNERLHGGNFAFVYYLDQPIMYAGLMIVEDTAYCHRLAIHPEGFAQHPGIVSSVLVSYQIRAALELGCRKYRLGFNENRLGLYRFWRDRLYNKLNLSLKTNRGNEMISNFTFLDRIHLFTVDQWVAELDLTRPNIEDFIIHEPTL